MTRRCCKWLASAWELAAEASGVVPALGDNAGQFNDVIGQLDIETVNRCQYLFDSPDQKQVAVQQNFIHLQLP